MGYIMNTSNQMDATFAALADSTRRAILLRLASGVASVNELAKPFPMSQPAVSKIEKQTDMYLSTLRGYVEAIGGQLDLIVRLPSRRPMHVRQLGDVLEASAKRGRRRPAVRSSKAPRKAAHTA